MHLPEEGVYRQRHKILGQKALQVWAMGQQVAGGGRRGGVHQQGLGRRSGPHPRAGWQQRCRGCAPLLLRKLITAALGSLEGGGPSTALKEKMRLGGSEGGEEEMRLKIMRRGL